MDTVEKRHEVKVLGSGCPNCRRLEAAVRKVSAETGVPAEIEKVTDYGRILEWGVMHTPGLVVDGTVVSTGRIPSEHEIAAWLTGEV